MPIYAYRCAECGHTKDALQKVSDAPLTVCPACGKDAFKKQLTAAGFQLKGTGWYVTDFRNGGGSNSAGATAGSGKPAEAAPDKPAGASADESAKKSADSSASSGITPAA